VRCGFVAEHEPSGLGTKELCSLVNVSRSSYYHWCSDLTRRTLSEKAERELF